MMKLKELEEWLQQLDGFTTPKVKLEQYETPAHIAARMVHTMESSFGDLHGKMVADLGCGCGMLTIGAVMMGAASCLGFDIDEDALGICKANMEDIEIEGIDLIQSDIAQLREPGSRWNKKFDTVILNPPFGTKHNQGIDMKFVQTALDLATTAVYSLHKTSTRAHILKKATDWGVKVKVIAQLRYNLPNTYKYHRKNSVDIEVDFMRFSF